MNIRRMSRFAALSAILLAGAAQAAPPFASYWYPDTLLKWNAATDPDAAFNRATVPLQQRVPGENVNPNASTKPTVMSVSVMQPTTSGNPAGWSDTFDAYTFTYWPYLTSLVSFAGSAGEGIIVPPTAGVIDAAHRNGVPVYGTVFFPPESYGGQVKWLQDTFQKDAQGHYPVADKLIEVAQAYGFDGWFINQETAGLKPEEAAQFMDFMRYLHASKPASMQVIWYDAMLPNGLRRFQNMLNNNNAAMFGTKDDVLADQLFLNYWWSLPEDMLSVSDRREKNGEPRIVKPGEETRMLELSAKKAQEMGRNPLDVYAGINIQGLGYDTANDDNSDNKNLDWSMIFPDGKGDSARLGVGLFGAEWTQRRALNWQDFQERENRTWTGLYGDPRRTDIQHNWKGIANYVTARTSLTTLPFRTSFNIGQGHLYAVEGKVVRHRDWNFMGVQDLMPTWRWLIDNQGGNELSASFDLERAFQGGSSLRLSGVTKAGGSSRVRLYAADAALRGGDLLQLTFQAPKNCVKASVQLGGGAWQDLALNNLTNVGDWTRGEVKLPASGKLSGLGVSVNCVWPEDGGVNIGQLAVVSRADLLPAPEISGLTLQHTLRDGIYSDARLTWQSTGGGRFEVYRARPGAESELVSIGNNGTAYIPEFRRLNKENVSLLSVVPVSAAGVRGLPKTVALAWPAYPAPVAGFRPGDTFVAPGSKVTFTNTSSEVAETFQWTFEGASPSTSTEASPTVTYAAPGTYGVTLVARNTAGESRVAQQGLVTVSPEASKISNLALNKVTSADGKCADKEAPEFGVDGKTDTKWCALGDAPHQLTVDLGGEFRITGFRVLHAEAGGEGGSMNTRAFDLQVSNDGKEWRTVASVTDNAAKESRVNIAQTQAKFARLLVNRPTQGGDSAARIYEFEVLGLPLK